MISGECNQCYGRAFRPPVRCDVSDMARQRPAGFEGTIVLPSQDWLVFIHPRFPVWTTVGSPQPRPEGLGTRLDVPSLISDILYANELSSTRDEGHNK